MIGRPVDKGVLSFDAKMLDLFPDMAKDMDPSLRAATLEQMLSHTAGLGDLQTEDDLKTLKAIIAPGHNIMEKRQLLARWVLSQVPEAPPGTRFKYSNLGYVVAAAAVEAQTHRSWEELMRQEVFVPLQMTTAGFGAPGIPGRIDAPYGHTADKDKLTPVSPIDSDAVVPPVLAPAGGLYMALADWARFVQDQVDGALGHGKLLKLLTYRHMQTPVAPSQVYGLGWGVKLASDGLPLILTHNGSTDPWFAEVRAYPKSNLITLVETNRGDDDGGGAAVKKIGKGLAEALSPQR